MPARSEAEKLNHEIVQGEETDQTRTMRELQEEYDTLKDTCASEGNSRCCKFDLRLI